MTKDQIETFFATLKAANPMPVTELEYRSVFELLVAVLLSAQATDQAVRRDRHAFAGHEVGQLLAQGLIAFGGAVLQRAAGLFRQRLVDGLPDALHVEHGRIRKAAGKRDDAGLAQQLEEFADGGGFNVVQAVGKLDGPGGWLWGMTCGNGSQRNTPAEVQGPNILVPALAPH